MVDSLVGWYPYSGDRRAIATVRQMLDYQLAHGTTPARWAWPSVPFTSSCAGDRRYGRCLAGLPKSFYGGIEPDKVALLGLGYLRFYELTGARKYLRAALSAANALARHVRAGNEARTPWPFRVNARNGAVLDGAQYGGLVVAPVQLFDELLRLRLGNAVGYRRARTLAWDLAAPAAAQSEERRLEPVERLLRGRAVQPGQQEPGAADADRPVLVDARGPRRRGSAVAAARRVDARVGALVARTRRIPRGVGDRRAVRARTAGLLLARRPRQHDVPLGGDASACCTRAPATSAHGSSRSARSTTPPTSR